MQELVLKEVLDMKENPYTVDEINLNKETIMIQSHKKRIEMTKADKLLRCIR